jgi:hypothetical protein
MKSAFTAILGLILGGVLAAWWMDHRATEEKPKETEHETESRVHHGTNGEVVIKLDAATQSRMGLQTAVLQSITLHPEVQGFGRVLDPAPLGAAAADILTATAALDASMREHERVKTLHAQGQNASARAVEAAEAAMKRDRVMLDAARLRLLSGWGAGLADRGDLPALVQRLARQEAALIEIGLPLGSDAPSRTVEARLSATGTDTPLGPVEFLGPSPNADPQTRGPGFLFLAGGSALRPGTAVSGRLSREGPSRTGMLVPSDALLYHEGQRFVYLQSAQDTFTRVEVKPEGPAPGGWVVGEGLAVDARVVTVGGQQLLSEELKGRGGDE